MHRLPSDSGFPYTTNGLLFFTQKMSLADVLQNRFAEVSEDFVEVSQESTFVRVSF